MKMDIEKEEAIEGGLEVRIGSPRLASLGAGWLTDDTMGAAFSPLNPSTLSDSEPGFLFGGIFFFVPSSPIIMM